MKEMTIVVCVSVRDVGPIALHCSEARKQENTSKTDLCMGSVFVLDLIRRCLGKIY